MDLCNDDSTYYKIAILIKVLCGANLHARAINIVEGLPSKKIFVSNYIPNTEKDECYVIIAESLLNSISSGKGLVHEVYIDNKKKYFPI